MSGNVTYSPNLQAPIALNPETVVLTVSGQASPLMGNIRIQPVIATVAVTGGTGVGLAISPVDPLPGATDLIGVSPIVTISSGPLSLPLVQPGDGLLVFEGTFTVDNRSAPVGFAAGGTGMAINPVSLADQATAGNGGVLYLSSEDALYYGAVIAPTLAEIQTAYQNNKTPPVAATLISPVTLPNDIAATNGLTQMGGLYDSNLPYPLVMTKNSYYPGPPQTAVVSVLSGDLSKIGVANAMVGDTLLGPSPGAYPTSRFFAGQMVDIPSEWRSILGGDTLIAHGGGQSVVAEQTCRGPGFSVFSRSAVEFAPTSGYTVKATQWIGWVATGQSKAPQGWDNGTAAGLPNCLASVSDTGELTVNSWLVQGVGAGVGAWVMSAAFQSYGTCFVTREIDVNSDGTGTYQLGTLAFVSMEAEGVTSPTGALSGTLAHPPAPRTVALSDGASNVWVDTNGDGNLYIGSYNDARASQQITGERHGALNSSGATPAGLSLDYSPTLPSTVSISDGTNTFTDNGSGVLTGSPAGTGTVNYSGGAFTITGGAPAGKLTCAYKSDFVGWGPNAPVLAGTVNYETGAFVLSRGAASAAVTGIYCYYGPFSTAWSQQPTYLTNSVPNICPIVGTIGPESDSFPSGADDISGTYDGPPGTPFFVPGSATLAITKMHQNGPHGGGVPEQSTCPQACEEGASGTNEPFVAQVLLFSLAAAYAQKTGGGGISNLPPYAIVPFPNYATLWPGSCQLSVINQRTGWCVVDSVNQLIYIGLFRANTTVFVFSINWVPA